MGGRDNNYQVVAENQTLTRYVPGGWVMFQRRQEFGGGFWLGKTMDYVFFLALDHPVTFAEGVQYLIHDKAEQLRHKTPIEITPQMPLF